MDKKNVNRHDLVFIKKQAKEHLYHDLQKQVPEVTEQLLAELFRGETDIPGIVRRNEAPESRLPVGFVSLQKQEGNRLRLAALIDWEDIDRIVSPYTLWTWPKTERTAVLRYAYQIKALADRYGIDLGVYGSVAMEMATRQPYTTTTSDIDLLIRPAAAANLQRFYADVNQLGIRTKVDIEISLPNGYGIQLKEWLSPQKTVLAKGMQQVEVCTKESLQSYFK